MDPLAAAGMTATQMPLAQLSTFFPLSPVLPTAAETSSSPLHSHSTTGAASAALQLNLLRQTSQSQEQISKNGLLKNVYVVVKNTPFVLQLGLTSPLAVNGQYLDFHHLPLDVTLLYDNDTFKPVSFIKTKPVDCKPTVNEQGNQLWLNTKIKVLTSQHEDMFFRVRMRVLDPKTKRPLLPPLEVLSEPIKVISKPKQLKKRKPVKKRSLNDLLVETAQRIEAQQKAQHQQIEALLARRDLAAAQIPSLPLDRPLKRQKVFAKCPVSMELIQSSSSSSSTTARSSLDTTATQRRPPARSSPTPQDQFLSAFVQFLSAFQSLHPEDKPAKIHRVAKTCSAKETEQLSELFRGLCSTPKSHHTSGCGGAKRSLKHSKEGSLLAGSSGNDGGCSCSYCPHRLELQRIDAFYKDFVASDLGFLEYNTSSTTGDGAPSGFSPSFSSSFPFSTHSSGTSSESPQE
ncbi:putative transcriptional regulator [Balamuthia mandrillaris]